MTRGNYLVVGCVLLASSLLLASLHVVVFHDARDTLFYILLDIAFLPLNVLLVTLVIDGLLSARERRERQRKLNMVIGAFFSAVGHDLMRVLAGEAEDQPEIAAHLGLDLKWTEAQIRQAMAWCRERKFTMRAEAGALAQLRDLLVEQRAFLLGLLENPLLLEHDIFSDLLWAVTHLAEELAARADLRNLPAADRAHLALDMERAYTQLQVQWLAYMAHLRRDYPYLFSFAARTNPLRPGARPEIEE
jgi:hypothetical protein